MPLHTVTCFTVTCDTCDEPLQYDEDGALHFTDPEQARAVARQFRWIPLADGRFLCAVQDEPHRAALDELMPAEPQPEAQLVFESEVGPVPEGVDPS